MTLPPHIVDLAAIVGDTIQFQYTLCITGSGVVILPEHGEQGNAWAELIELARRGDKLGFDAVAGCLMPTGEVEECWRGTRARLGLTK